MNNIFSSNEIFGINDVNPASCLKGMGLLYESEHGKPGTPDYRQEQVLRNEDGQYYMSVKCGERASCFDSLHHDFAGREVFFPVAPEALSQWARTNLCGGDYGCALKEFDINVKLKEKVWQYQQGSDKTQPGFIYEYLRKTNTDTYALFSTDCSYPYLGSSTTVAEPGSHKVRDDLYLYYITADTARRWAEAKGMDEYTSREIFG